MLSAIDSCDGTPNGRNFLKKWRPGQLDEEDEFWELYSFDGCVYELYRSKATVVWSRGGNVLKVFKGESTRVRLSLATHFHSYPRRPSVVLNEKAPDEAAQLGDSPLAAVCLLEERRSGDDSDGCLRIFREDGEDFRVVIPFEASACWATHYGLLFEGDPKAESCESSNTSNVQHINSSCRANVIPNWFCLLHPLDDFTQIMMKQPRESATDKNHKVVFVSKDPSLCLTFNSRSGQHHVWHLRPATVDETSDLLRNTSLASQTPMNTPTRLLNQSAPTPSSSGCISRSLIHSHVSRTLRSHHQSPVSALASFTRSPASPASSSVHFAGASFRKATPTYSKLMERMQCGNTTMMNSDPPTVSPDIFLCLDLVWVEPAAVARQSGLQSAQKAFLARDSAADNYLCYLRTNQLSLARFGSSTGYRLGAVNHLPALDAAPVQSLDMIVVLELSRQAISLYSGLVKVGRLNFNASPVLAPPVSHIAQEISALNLGSQPQTPQMDVATPANSLPGSPFYCTSSRPPSAQGRRSLNPLDDSQLALLSPVAAQLELATGGKMTAVESIGPCVSNQVHLKYASGSWLRLYLPTRDSCSPLVSACVGAICAALPKDCAIQLSTRWFACRNAPGPASLSPNKERRLFTQCLLGLLGYHPEHLVLLPMDSDPSSSEAASPAACNSKKPRKIESGSDGDWEFLLSSVHHQEAGQKLSQLLGLPAVTSPIKSNSEDLCNVSMDQSAILFSHLPQVVHSLHLLYEDMKLDRCMTDGLQYLAGLLVRLTADLELSPYVRHYWRDFPHICPPHVDGAKTHQMSANDLRRFRNMMSTLPADPPDVFQYLTKILYNRPLSGSYPFLSLEVSRRSRDFSVCYAILANKEDIGEQCLSSRDPEREGLRRFLSETQTLCATARVVKALVHLRYDQLSLQTFPSALTLPLLQAIHKSRLDNSCQGLFNKKENLLIGRDDLFSHSSPGMESYGAIPRSSEDGIEDLEEEQVAKLRWPSDKRLVEVRRMLQSALPVPITVTQRPEISDHEFVEEQERCLHSICVRTMALSVGRGALTLFMSSPLLTEPMPIPKLCLSGKAPPRGAAVEMEHIDIVPNMDRWPLFHNGVAAGLRMSPRARYIDSTWIVFNKPKDRESSNLMIEHGGLLLALGLGGHLTKLGKLDSFEYLMKGHEHISIGVLLGLAASQRGSMDVVATKKVSTQLVALLPPSATELPLTQMTQTAALMSVGLLYQGTGHRHMTEVCLGELGRPPGPELENCTDRESYSLAAGLALGMITFGKGPELTRGPLADLDLADVLYYHMVGGPRSALGAKAAKYQHQSFQVREGDSINVDVTGPGATLALGMMFFNSSNITVADWMLAPATQHLLEFVRPDLLMLRAVARGLILWDEVLPSLEWLESHVPEAIRPYCLIRPDPETHPEGTDYETINQAYLNLVAGAALAMGLRFAGSANAKAFEALDVMTKRLIALSTRSVAGLAGRATVEQAICVLVLAQGMLMAGTGDLELIRTVRYLRSRVGANHSTVTYGSHLAYHLALGLLFLGGGRLTLSTEPMAVAAMICAFYPKFPTHSNDNRYHLQALRHLYVLAAEPRLLVPRDSTTGVSAYANFEVTYAASSHYPSTTLSLRAPALLPELKYLSSVRLVDDRYHGFTFLGHQGLKQLQNILTMCQGELAIKQKAGCLPYSVDPLGFLSMTAQTLSRDNTFQWSSSSLRSFSSDPIVKGFSQVFLEGFQQDQEHNLLSSILYDCAKHEKVELFNIWVETLQTVNHVENQLNGPSATLLALLLSHSEQQQRGQCFISPEIVASLQQRLVAAFERWQQKCKCGGAGIGGGTSGGSGGGSLRQLDAATANFVPFADEKNCNNPLELLERNPDNVQYDIFYCIE